MLRKLALWLCPDLAKEARALSERVQFAETKMTEMHKECNRLQIAHDGALAYAQECYKEKEQLRKLRRAK